MKDEKCSCGGNCTPGIDRRDFLRLSGVGSLGLFAGLAVMAGPFHSSDFQDLVPVDKKLSPEWVKSLFERGIPQVYKGEELKFIGMPVGGICAGQVYLGGDGRLWHWDIFNKRYGTGDAHYAHPMEPSSPLDQGFAIKVSSNGKTETRRLDKTGFPDVTFRGEYPVGMVEYQAKRPDVETDNDPSLLAISLEAFSPFIPLSVDESSLPATIMRFTVQNHSAEEVEATLFGWLENAVCLYNRGLNGIRHNRIVHGKGYSFLNCTVEKAPESKASERPDITFEDWHDETYTDWVAQGNAFGKGPVRKSEMPGYQGDVGGDTERVVNSHATAATAPEVGSRDTATGTLTSRKFRIERKFINCWIGGGGHKDKTCLNVIIDGKVALSATGMNDNKMTLQSLNVQDLEGKEAYIQIVDAEKGGWGNIGVGRITFSDEQVVITKLEKAYDFGTMGLALLGDHANYTIAHADGGLGGVEGTGASSKLMEHLTGAIGRQFKLAGGESAVITFAITWNFPNLTKPGIGRYYASKFTDAQAVAGYLARNIKKLYAQTKLWRDTWYDSTLPYWFLDRTFTNASTLATSTAFRFFDGKFWGWEGVGCCEGTCTHVWHYEQTMGRIFPELDIVLREKTDFNPNDSYKGDGVVEYRGKGSGSAIDGQAGIILRSLRDHQMSPNDAFLKRNWQKIKKALEWLIDQDGTGDGILKKNQHNTLDAEWFGDVAWLSGLYLAALRAGEEMALEMNDTTFAGECHRILEAGRKNFVGEMWNGEYFIQVGDPQKDNSVGSYDGCEIDQVFGQSWAWQIGLGHVLPREETRQALKALWKYNFTPDVGPYREAYKPGRWYAMAGEAGTLMCTWPKGESKRVKTNYDYYFNECMNGFEHQLSGHMIRENMLLEGFAIERAIHDRYHAIRRNPWNEVECGDHYARSMASYGVFLAACGFEYHGPKGHIGFAPRLTPEDFKAPFTSAEGWGTYEQRAEGKGLRAKVTVKYGKLRIKTVSLDLKRETESATVSVTLNGKKIKSRFLVKEGTIIVTLATDALLMAGGRLEIFCES